MLTGYPVSCSEAEMRKKKKTRAYRAPGRFESTPPCSQPTASHLCSMVSPDEGQHQHESLRLGFWPKSLASPASKGCVQTPFVLL